MKKIKLKRLAGWLYAAIIVLLCVLFFTNDFGLVDLRKSSVIIGMGVDYEDDELILTAQLALPRPAENGENTEYTVVTGSGDTVARALNDINVKTGFYPKLVFCKLIILGESCFDKDIVSNLNYFFASSQLGLTPKIAAFSGSAEEFLSLKLPYGDSATEAAERLLSEESQKTANVSTANLNDFGQGYYSQSGAAYMPYIEVDGAGEESESGASGEEGESEAQSGDSSNVQFTCAKTAIFTRGKFAGILSEEQAFAFNLLNGDIRRTYIASGTGEDGKTLSIRHCKGDIKLNIKGGLPVLTLSFSAAAKVQDSKPVGDKQRGEGQTSASDLRSAEELIKEKMESLYEYTHLVGCDLLGAKNLLYKTQNKYFAALKGSIADVLTVECDVNLKSAA